MFVSACRKRIFAPSDDPADPDWEARPLRGSHEAYTIEHDASE